MIYKYTSAHTVIARIFNKFYSDIIILFGVNLLYACMNAPKYMDDINAT